MKLERHLKLSNPEPGAQQVRVAFATRDRKRIDQHFGSACSFMIYRITPDNCDLLEVAEFTETEQDRNHSKLLTKLELLQGCQAVFCNAIGAAAVRQLLSLGVQPLRALPGTPIAREIRQLQTLWYENPPHWLRQHTQPGQGERRFDAMEAEGWDE
ncbi:NifB/NifX family molybdenum-iron cluster-binding protein [Aestuariirhabdus litorea]|uniref:Nitrogen fixation protein NifX n=1 Tax=Aestuariirhabdus litorea TaxID=2528527 RepID=A0A3P3VJP3_9GAMM|nr:NifB/NifX family molybdenum-iron cluster-binding protein [Aestuariirhabdus litorea]RRJ82922.1 nitrogen fixation protein NifX [Aestuariirhabdus litorea]RWW93081.1 nitrogen fixation protein NifX [Endozoicomonadaceae bacterium GTF-13]